MKILILMYCTFIGMLCALAATETVDGVRWTYFVNGYEVRIGGSQSDTAIPESTEGDIVIPSMLGGYPVREISNYAFYRCAAITSVEIPNSVTNISGVYIFLNCKSLKSVTIPISVKCINSGAFSQCPSIKNIETPSGVYDSYCKISSLTNLVISDGSTMIRYAEFSDISALKRVTIPNSITNIGSSAFSGCTSLEEVHITDLTSWCSISFGNSTANPLSYANNLYVDGMKIVNLEISDEFTNVTDYVFHNCSSLENVMIPNSVLSIGKSAFYGCSSLKRVTMSDSVKSIGSSAFSGCISLADINGLPQGVCTGKVSKVFPSYQSITNIVVADGVTRIAAECFKDCLSLKKIVIPASVSVIYDNAFQNCSALEEIVFLGDAPDVGSDILIGTPRSLKITVKEGSVGWNGGVSTELPEVWPVGDATARGISYYDDSADVAAMAPVITPADGNIFADTCEVSISCAMEGAKIYYRTDGKTPKFTDAYLYKGAFTISDTSKIVAVAVKEGVENGFATATLTKRVLTLAEAAGDADLTFTTGGAADWVPIGDLTAADGVSARSGAVGDEEKSWMELSVSGSGTLTFNWKVSCEDDPVSATWDHLVVFVDGNEREDLCFDGETGWETASIVLDSDGVHTVRWVYVKDESDSEGEDCTWISSVNWAPTLSGDITVDIGDDKNVVVPVSWIDKYDSIVTAAGGDKAAALRQTAANGRKVWECFMLGVDPTKADDDFKITRFWMEGGKPMFEFSHSTDGAGNSFVPRLKVKGKAKLSDGWSDVPEGGNSAFRFFTVEVELP